MAERQFKDCDGDTWTEVEPGTLQITEYATGTLPLPEWTLSISDVQHAHGPLTEIRTDVDVRALLADVMDGLADEVLKDYWEAPDPVSERIYGRLAHRIRGQVLKLREVSE